ncbi:ABC transporter substrate-binding protein [Rickettsiella endosymbiont of Miltochrista miniata]|uniref:ABC transporter substrate-binding protein n=1 Tax=Rickettsiella endosymbiont of Miltochrista miniata TaxID=3066239 RepID=UPI00313B33B7
MDRIIQKIKTLFMPIQKKFILIVSFLLFTSNAWAKPLTLILDWLVNPDHAAIFVAKEQGFFAREGIQVNIIAPSNPDDGPKLVAAGHADLAVSYQPQLVVQAAKGLPLIRVASLINQPLNCLIVKKNGPIHQLADLKGKRIAYTSHVEGTMMLSALLEKAHLTMRDVQTINVQYDLTQALLSDRVDAVINVMRNVEPLQMQFAHQPVKIFPIELATIPTYDELIIIANKNKLSDPRLSKFLIALDKATQYLLNNPEKSWEVFAKNHPALNKALNHQIWQTTLPYIARHPVNFDKKDYTKFMLYLYQKRIISQPLMTDKYATELTY